MKSNKKVDVTYDTGDWHIDNDGKFIMEHNPHIDLIEDMWVELDEDGYFCKVMTHHGEVFGEEGEPVLDEFDDIIDYAQDRIAEEYADAYREYLIDHNMSGEIEVVDSQYLSANKSAYITLMATPLANIHIIKFSLTSNQEIGDGELLQTEGELLKYMDVENKLFVSKGEKDYGVIYSDKLYILLRNQL